MSDRHRQQLRQRLQKRFELTTREVSVGDGIVSFTQIKNPDTVLDQIVAEADRREKISGRKQTDDELHLPYWAELWDSAIGIGEYLIANDDGKPRSAILDLGCGMGFAGTIATKLGHRVLFADIERDPLLFAALNALQFSANVRARRVDWRRDRLDEKFNLIIGADVLYDKTQWEFLDQFWRAHLSRDGSILLGEPGRQTGELFPTWLTAKNFWKLEQFEQRIKSREKPIRLFRLFQ